MAAAPQTTGQLAEENAFVRFFRALFEFSFNEEQFVTPRLIPILYGLALTGIGLGVLAKIFNVLNDDLADGSDKMFSILIVFALGLLGVLYVRVVFELIVVLFKIAEPVTDTARTLHRIEGLLTSGVPVSAPGSGSADAVSSDPICSNCGAQVGAEEKFCRSCGHGLGDRTD